MKYDLSNKTNRFAQRTLAAFSDTLFQLLEKESFEAISVNELCEASNYPRATFYNYFEDIYDLLEYCWLRMSQEIKIEDYMNMQPEERITVLFDRMYSFLEGQKPILQRVLEHNSPDGKLIDSLSHYIRKRIMEIMSHCSCTDRYTIPYEIIAEHYGNTLLLVMEWSFLRRQPLSKEKAQECVNYLLKSI